LIFPRHLIGPILSGQKTQVRKKAPTYGRTACYYQQGHSYAVQTSQTSPPTCRILITEVRREFLHVISAEDAEKEGFPDRDSFFAWWRETYKEGPWLEIPVWVISFELDKEEHDEYMSAGVVAGKQGDYQSTPIRALDPDAPCPPRSVVDRYAEENRERFEQQKSLAEAVAELEKVADPKSLASLHKRIRGLQRKFHERLAA
jgi:uncharacterized protein YhfF